jgi:EmrB/QacA subfamily drug resistance transporter
MSTKWKSFGLAATGILLSTIDSSALGIALPIVSADFGLTVDQASLVVTIYQITLTSLVLTAARISEAWGFRRAYVTGYGLFFIGSLFSTLSTGLGTLVAARFVQALGAAFLLAVNPALVVSVFGSEERGKGLGLVGGTVGLGLITGPLVGGLLTGALGWRSIFWINLPIALLGIFASTRILPKQETKKISVGWSNLFWVFTVFCFMNFLTLLPRAHQNVELYLLAAGFAVALSVFLHFEKGEKPLVGFELYRRAPFTLGVLALFLCYAALFSATFLAPFYLHQILHKTPFEMGRMMSSIPLAVMLVAPLSGRLSDKLGNRWISAVGLFLLAFGVFSMVWLGTPSTPLEVVRSLILVGVGTAIFQSPNSNSIMASVPSSRLATAAGMIATIRNLGMAFGAAFSSTLFAFWQREYSSFPPDAAFVHAFQNVFKVTGWLAAAGIFVALARGRILYDSEGQPVVRTERPAPVRPARN